MPEAKQNVSAQEPDVVFGWEDSGIALVEKFVCICGADLIEGCTDYTVSDDDHIECPKCKRVYHFTWVGMTADEVAMPLQVP